MKTQHTPGPWICDQYGVIVGGTDMTTSIATTVENLWRMGGQFDLADEAKCNGRLIAAAPTMLAALEETRDFLMGGNSLESADPWVRELISDTIDPAIARARGES